MDADDYERLRKHYERQQRDAQAVYLVARSIANLALYEWRCAALDARDALLLLLFR